MEVKDRTTPITYSGYNAISGFSIKSDIGSPPTLINASKNTRFKYEIFGISDFGMNEINNIDKYTDKEYMNSRFQKLFSLASYIKYDSMISSIYNKKIAF